MIFCRSQLVPKATSSRLVGAQTTSCWTVCEAKSFLKCPDLIAGHLVKGQNNQPYEQHERTAGMHWRSTWRTSCIWCHDTQWQTLCKEWRDRRMGKCPSLVQNLHINCLIANLSMCWLGQCARCKTLQKELSQSISSCKSIGEPQTWQWHCNRGWGEVPKIDQGLTGNAAWTLIIRLKLFKFGSSYHL